jgi:hypothetical protein
MIQFELTSYLRIPEILNNFHFRENFQIVIYTKTCILDKTIRNLVICSFAKVNLLCIKFRWS